jgi:Domain of unknown function (DUF4126)
MDPTDPLGLEAISVLLAALGLSSVSGLRAYFPLLAVAAAANIPNGQGSHIIQLSPQFKVLGNGWFVALLVVLVLGEFVVDKVPGLDHASDAVHTIIRPISGAIIMAGVDNPLSHQNVWAAAIVGAVLALTVHTAKAATRPVVTAGTAGIGNPIVSFAEDALVVVVSVLAFVAPYLAVLLLILLAIGAWQLLSAVIKVWRRRQPVSP